MDGGHRGPLLFFGLFTRPVAFVLSGEMAVAYFTQHANAGFWPILNRGELAVHYGFAWLFIAVAGAESWNLDALRARRRHLAGWRQGPRSGWPAGSAWRRLSALPTSHQPDGVTECAH